MNDRNAGSLLPLAAASSLSSDRVERFYCDLLERLADQRLPAAALPAMHEFYDRFQPQREYFLHHFGSFLPHVDRRCEVRTRQPRLLDLGCGVGTQAHLLAARGARVTGLDFDAQRIAGAKAMTNWFVEEMGGGELPVEFHAADAFSFLAEQSPETFDGCYTQFALAYMRPYRELLAAVDRVVRPGGRLILREFNAGSIYNRLRTRVDWLDDRAYQRILHGLGWRLEYRRFHWFLPRQVVRFRVVRKPLGVLEDLITRPLPLGRNLAAAMTLVFQKGVDR